jgi:hypothetical protein
MTSLRRYVLLFPIATYLHVHQPTASILKMSTRVDVVKSEKAFLFSSSPLSSVAHRSIPGTVVHWSTEMAHQALRQPTEHSEHILSRKTRMTAPEITSFIIAGQRVLD